MGKTNQSINQSLFFRAPFNLTREL